MPLVASSFCRATSNIQLDLPADYFHGEYNTIKNMSKYTRLIQGNQSSSCPSNWLPICHGSFPRFSVSARREIYNISQPNVYLSHPNFQI